MERCIYFWNKKRIGFRESFEYMYIVSQATQYCKSQGWKKNEKTAKQNT